MKYIILFLCLCVIGCTPENTDDNENYNVPVSQPTPTPQSYSEATYDAVNTDPNDTGHPFNAGTRVIVRGTPNTKVILHTPDGDFTYVANTQGYFISIDNPAYTLDLNVYPCHTIWISVVTNGCVNWWGETFTSWDMRAATYTAPATGLTEDDPHFIEITMINGIT